MDNTFTSATRNITTTENGHAATRSTGTAVLDLYSQIGALRGMNFDTRVKALVDAAVAESRLLTAKTIFYGRDARGGTGERQLFRDIIKYCATNYPGVIKPNIYLIPKYGRWDDLYALVNTPLEQYAAAVIRAQLYNDMDAIRENRPVSLLCKWLKSCNTSSEESRALGRWTAKMLDLSEREYRKLLSTLRAHINIVETQMSENQWADIDYEHIPSRAGLIYREAFNRHDHDRYITYLEDVRNGKAKMNASMNTPQDIIHALIANRGENETLEAMWKNLPDYVNTDENIMVMADVSGSMYGRPIEVSIGLAMYFAQHNKGAFHNLFMTFESEPSFVSLKDEYSLRENYRVVNDAPWGGSTNLNKACEAMLAFAVNNKVPDEDMPKRLIIISDMEIDTATSGWRGMPFSGALHPEELREMYGRYGYTMPQIIYWNVDARDNHFQATATSKGVMLASGSSPAVFEAVVAMEDMEITPYTAMLEVLNGERYERIRAI